MMIVPILHINIHTIFNWIGISGNTMDQGQIISKIGKLLKTVTSDGLENEPGTENLVKLILESLATLFYETAESVLMYLVASKKRKSRGCFGTS